MTVRSGETVTLPFSCSGTDISLPTISGVTLVKDECRVRFSTATPGSYEVTVVATADANKSATARITVVPNIQMTGPAIGSDKMLRTVPAAATYNFTMSGGDSGGAAEWSVRNYDPAIKIGSFLDKTSGVFTPDKIGQGLAIVTLKNTAGGAAVTASMGITVLPDLFIVGERDTAETREDTLNLANDALRQIKLQGTIADTLPPITPPVVPTGWDPAYGSPTGLWADRNPGSLAFGDPNAELFGSLTISGGNYLYWNFTGVPAPVPGNNDISGYTKVDIVGADFSALRPGQWAVFNFTWLFMGMPFGAYQCIVIAPKTEIEWSLTIDDNRLDIGSIDAYGYFTPGIHDGGGIVTASVPDTYDIATGDRITVSRAIKVGAVGGGAVGKPNELTDDKGWTQFFGPGEAANDANWAGYGIPATAYTYLGWNDPQIFVDHKIEGYEYVPFNLSSFSGLKERQWSSWRLDLSSIGYGVFYYVVINPAAF
jgi:hypothetical protein